MDARRSQVYTGIYEFEGGKLRTHLDACAVPLEEVEERLNSMNRRVILLGDGVDAFKDRLKEELRCDYVFAPPQLSKQRAGAVGALGLEMLKEGLTVSAAEHVPVYLRLSQAERELKERQQAK